MTFNPEPRPSVLQLGENPSLYVCELCPPKTQREAPTDGTMVLHYRSESYSASSNMLSLCPAHRIAVANTLLSDVRAERGVIPVQVMLLISHLVQIGYDVLITSVTKMDVLFSIACTNPKLVAQTLGYHGVRLGVTTDLYCDADRVFGSWWVKETE
jgi:hypothetical protein